MFQITSQTITEDTKAELVPLIEWKFQISNGNTGEVVISDPLLDSYDRALERANSEFLKSSYKMREVRFGTHKTDFTKNEIINVRALPYLVKSISSAIDKVSVKTTIRGIRYEQ